MTPEVLLSSAPEQAVLGSRRSTSKTGSLTFKREGVELLGSWMVLEQLLIFLFHQFHGQCRRAAVLGYRNHSFDYLTRKALEVKEFNNPHHDVNCIIV